MRIFLAALAVLLTGYMFFGRGFAHLGIGPVYVSELVLALGLIAAVSAMLRRRGRPEAHPVLLLLLAFMGLGLVDTVPYLPVYGRDALRDGVLWGYGFFALIIFIVADRRVIEDALRAYGRVLPVFAIWLPISWYGGIISSAEIDPTQPGAMVPLVYFKAGDMAVHTAAGIAFVVAVATPAVGVLNIIWRSLLSAPLVWTIYTTAAVNRGSMLASVAGLVASGVVARRARAWLPIAAGAVMVTLILAPSLIPKIQSCGQPSSAAQERAVDPCQIAENAASIFTNAGDGGLQGTKSFRLAWWGAIIDYTVRGPYFWTGKGFGVNLADSDGFQPTADHSLRAPHNSHLTALARMGVPGFVLWVLLQGAFALGLFRAFLRHRRAGDQALAGAAAWIGVFWVAAMVNTSFDPYLEGPQGGIWFWVLVGLGTVIMRLQSQPGAALPRIGLPLELGSTAPVRP